MAADGDFQMRKTSADVTLGAEQEAGPVGGDGLPSA